MKLIPALLVVATLTTSATAQDAADILFKELKANRIISEMMAKKDTALVTVFPDAFNGLSMKEKNLALAAVMKLAIRTAPDVGTVVVYDATNMRPIGIFRTSHGYHGF